MDIYDICYEISRYLYPSDYSCINNIFYRIACQDNTYIRILHLMHLYEEKKFNELVLSSTLNELILWLYKDLIILPNHTIGRIINQDKTLTHWFDRAIRERNINLIRFMKDNIGWKYCHFQLTYPINIHMLFSNDIPLDIIRDVGITLDDIKYMPYKFIINNIDLIIDIIDSSRDEILREIHNIYINAEQRYDQSNVGYMDILWMLLSNGYHIGQCGISYKDLIKANKEQYLTYIHDKSWIISNCKLDIILKYIHNNDQYYNIKDLIKNRHYPVFKTLCMRSDINNYEPFELLCLAAEYHNTEAFKVLTCIYSYTIEQFVSIINKYKIIKKGIRLIIKYKIR